MPTPPTQGRARPRVGATVLVLGTLWCKYSSSGSAGVASNAPSRGEVGRGPAARCALSPGEGGASTGFWARPLRMAVAGLTPPYWGAEVKVAEARWSDLGSLTLCLLK